VIKNLSIEFLGEIEYIKTYEKSEKRGQAAFFIVGA
jgi:hypothetical protein